MTWIWHTSRTTSLLWVLLPKGGEVITSLSCVSSLILSEFARVLTGIRSVCRWHAM